MSEDPGLVAVGIAEALGRQSLGDVTCLLLGGAEPVSDREVLLAACQLLWDLASAHGQSLGRPAGEVLAGLLSRGRARTLGGMSEMPMPRDVARLAGLRGEEAAPADDGGLSADDYRALKGEMSDLRRRVEALAQLIQEAFTSVEETQGEILRRLDGRAGRKSATTRQSARAATPETPRPPGA